MSPPRSHLHVEELVVRGFGASGHLVANALEEQLARLLSDEGALAPFLSADGAERIDGGRVPLGADSATVGQRAADAVVRSVGP